MKFPILISYAYARKHPEQFAEYADHPAIEVLLDSGAFTAKNTGQSITLEEYCTFLDKWGGKVFRYLALDVVGDPEGTDRNLLEMISSGYNPVPVHVLGDDQRRMDYLFELSDYVALAGLRRPQKGACSQSYIKAKMKWANGRSVHWLGYVREPMIAGFRPFSCDSASWTRAHQFGGVDLYLGRGQWQRCASYEQRAKISNQWALKKSLACINKTMRDFHDPLSWRLCTTGGSTVERFVSMGVTVDSWVRYVIDVFRQYGTRIFLATSLAGSHELHFMKGAIERHADTYLDLV